MTLNLNLSAPVKSTVQRRSATITNTRHPTVTAMTRPQTLMTARMSLCCPVGTVMILPLPRAQTGLAGISGSPVLMRRRSTTGNIKCKTYSYMRPHYKPVIMSYRWNPRSEHLHRKAYRTTGRRGSLVELEEFADSYEQRGDRGARRREQEREDYETELVEFRGYPCYRNGPPQYYHDSEKDLDDDDNHEEHSRHYKQNRHNISPLHSPKKRRGTWEKEVNVPPPPTTGPQLTVFEEKDYDATFLNSLLERKAKLRGVGHGRSRSRSEDDSDTPSKGSSRKGSRESNLQCSHIASSRPETSSRPPSADTERARGDRPSPRPPQASTHSSQPSAHSLSSRREEHREKGHKVVSNTDSCQPLT